MELDPLPQQKNGDGLPMFKYQEFWCPAFVLQPLKSFQKNFKAYDTDIILASLPKSGTTWLKALLFSVINRNHFPVDQSPLLSSNPHKLVLSLECTYYISNDNPDLEKMTQPRLFSTHLPHKALGSSLIASKCKIIYVARNPLDQFISERHFLMKIPAQPDADPPLPVEESFDKFVQGLHAFGPYWDHVLGYWSASLENPNRVLFLRYEDLKMDPVSNARRIAEFLERPFSDEEENEGLPGEICKLCSFENLKNLETNQIGEHIGGAPNSMFFRKGEVGDWKNHLTPAMGARMKQVMDEKLSGSGLILMDDA